MRVMQLGGAAAVLFCLACPGSVAPTDGGEPDGGVADAGGIDVTVDGGPAADAGANKLTGALAFDVHRADIVPAQWDGAADWGNVGVLLYDDPTVSACQSTSVVPGPITRTQLSFGVTSGHPTALSPMTFDGDGSDGGGTFAFVHWSTIPNGGSVFSPGTVTVSSVAGSLVTGTFSMHAPPDGGPSPLEGSFAAVPCSVQVDTELNLVPPFSVALAHARNARAADGGADASRLKVGLFEAPPSQSLCGDGESTPLGVGRTVWIHLTEPDGGPVAPGSYAVNGRQRNALVHVAVVSDGGIWSRLASSGSVELSYVGRNGTMGRFSSSLNAIDGGVETVSGKFLARQSCP